MKSKAIFIVILLCMREVYSVAHITKACQGGSSYGSLENTNVCSGNCDANCCGILGGSNTFCQTQLANIANNITLGQALGLCGLASNGDYVCSLSAGYTGAACLLNLLYLKQVLAVCQLGLLAVIGSFGACMEANNLLVNQLVACCSTNDDGDVTCLGSNICSNTYNYENYYYAETDCCTVQCGVYS